MKNLTLYLAVYLGTMSILHSQPKNCQNIYDDALALFKNNDNDKALETLHDLENCDYKKALVQERQALQSDIFAAIKKQKEEAEKSKKEAEKARKEAENEKDKSESLTIKQYNISNAYKKIQNNPTEAWNIATALDASLETTKEIISTLSNEDKNGYYNKMLNTDTDILAIGWQKNEKNENVLLTACADGVLYSWNTEGGLIGSFVFDTNKIKRTRIIEISKNGAFMFCGNSNGSVSIWDLEKRQHKANQIFKSSDIQLLAISNNNNYWAIAFNDSIMLFSEKTKFLKKFTIDCEPATLTVSNTGLVFVGFKETPAKFFDFKNDVKRKALFKQYTL
jgi:WD40 repeat protein